MDLSSTTSHWGAYRAAPSESENLPLRVQPHPDDPAPSPLLENIADSVHHPTRIAKPAIRRGWLEHGPGPSAARGTEEFVETSWETALDIVAEQLERTVRVHGNEAVYAGSYGWASAGRFHHAPSQLHRFLNTLGGYTGSRGNYSNGASTVLLRYLIGDPDLVLHHADSWQTIREHADLVVAFGGLPLKNLFVTPGGITQHQGVASLRQLSGPSLAVVSPLPSDVPEGPDARWYRIEPRTDTALILGLAHTLLTEGLHDERFLTRCCTGFDKLADYLLGRQDDTPKSAEWAQLRCGVPAAQIRQLARQMASGRTLITMSWSLQRTENGEQPIWAGLCLAAMLGQIGLPGGGFAHGHGSMADVGDAAPLAGLPALPQGTNPVSSFIPVARIADMLLKPGEPFHYTGQTFHYPNIRLVYWAGGNPFHHHQDLNRLRRAFQRPDTIIVHEPHWTATARHADIVLPVATSLEREDIGAGRRDTRVIAMRRILEPVGEARTDHEIFTELAHRLGVRAQFTAGRTPRQWLEHLYEQWRAGQGGAVPDFHAFWRAGECQVPEQPRRTPFADFRESPDRYPLATQSGRIELFSEQIASYRLPDMPGHPVWIAPPPSRWPLLLIANQPATRLHSQGDVGRLSQRNKVNGREPVRINPDDAATRGIREGDAVRVHNDRGACLVGARIDPEVPPGIAVLPTGAWFDPLPDASQPGGVLCVHGNPNVLTADQPSSQLTQGCTGQHAHVEIERCTTSPPAPRYLFPPPLAGEV